jgi:hypothetical protein
VPGLLPLAAVFGVLLVGVPCDVYYINFYVSWLSFSLPIPQASLDKLRGWRLSRRSLSGGVVGNSMLKHLPTSRPFINGIYKYVYVPVKLRKKRTVVYTYKYIYLILPD